MEEFMTINVTRSSMPGFEEYCEEIRELWDSHFLTNMGVKHQQLEKALEEYLDVPHAVLFANGHLALENAIAYYNFPQGSEVITTPFTFVSTTHAIVRNGLTPVFCDVNEEDFTIDAEKIEDLITEKTVAVVPVHVYGNLCHTEKIQAIADKHGLKVIYDAAHAFGVKKNGVGAANFGDMSMFSFHATKVFNTIEGGAVCFREDEPEVVLNHLKNFGISGLEECVRIGGNAKMNEFQAAMGICNLRHLDDEIAKRKAAAERYDRNLAGIEGIRVNRYPADITANYAYYPVIFDSYKYSRDEVYRKLRDNGILSRKYFYPLTSDFDCYRDYEKNDTPCARYLAAHVLTLPMYADLSEGDIDRICRIIGE